MNALGAFTKHDKKKEFKEEQILKPLGKTTKTDTKNQK